MWWCDSWLFPCLIVLCFPLSDSKKPIYLVGVGVIAFLGFQGGLVRKANSQTKELTPKPKRVKSDARLITERSK